MNGQDYAAAGTAFALAWERLCEGCEVPPSLEVFRKDLEDARRSSPARHVDVLAVADRIVRNYRRIEK